MSDAASAAPGVDLQLPLNPKRGTSVSLGEEMNRLVNQALGDRFDGVVLRVRLLDVDGRTRETPRVAVSPGSIGQGTWLSLDDVERTHHVTLRQNPNGAPGSKWYGGMSVKQIYRAASMDGPHIGRITLRLEPVPGATPVP